MKPKFHVLSIGPAEALNMTYNRPLEDRGFVLAVAQGYRDLHRSEMRGEYEVVALPRSLSNEEPMESAHFILRRWPAARIRLIRAREWWKDDALYDDRVVRDINPESLVAAVELVASRLPGSTRNKKGRRNSDE